MTGALRSPADLVRACDLDQLARFGLVEHKAGQVALTGFGQVRLARSRNFRSGQ